MFFRRGATNQPPASPFVGAFGKVVQAGDFVRVTPPDRRSDAAQTSFEQWLASAVGWMDIHNATPSPEERLASPTLGFVYRPRPRAGNALVVGALRWSRDTVGRTFPFTVFAVLSDEVLAATPHLLPLAAAWFVAEAAGIVDVATDETATSMDGWKASVAALAPPVLDATIVAPALARTYADWAAQTRLDDYWTSLYGPRGQEVSARYAVHTLAEALQPFRGSDEPATQLGLSLPLGGRGPQAVDGILATALWVDLARRAGGWKTNTPSFFWHFGAAPRLVLSLGELHPSMLIEATHRRGDHDRMCDLGGSAGSSAGYHSLPARLMAALSSSEANDLSTPTVADLLATSVF